MLAFEAINLLKEELNVSSIFEQKTTGRRAAAAAARTPGL